MGELMSGRFTLEISSDGQTLSSNNENDHGRMHILLNTPMTLDHRKSWYATMSSIEISKNVDTVICAPDVKKELSIRVGRMEQNPHKVNHNVQDKIPVTWIGESCISFDFTHDLHTPTPSFISADTVVKFIERNENYNRVQLLNDKHMTEGGKTREKRFMPIGIGEDVQPHKFFKYPFGLRNLFFNPNPIESYFNQNPPPHVQISQTIQPKLKKQESVRHNEKKYIMKQMPWSHLVVELKKHDLPNHFFSLTDVLEVKVIDNKLDFSVKANNQYGVNYAVIRAPTELSYMFGFPYEFSTNEVSPCDPWYFAEGSKRWRIKACGVCGNTKPWDIWCDKNLQIYHFNETCNPLHEVNNVKVITDFTEVPLTENKPVINSIPLGAWISNPATKHYHMCIQSLINQEWRRVITPGCSSISTVKLHLESASGYPLRVLSKRKATRITITFHPV